MLIKLSYSEKKTIFISCISIIMFLFVSLWNTNYSFQEQYLSIHIILEFFSIAVSMAIAFQAWLTFPYTQSKQTIYLGALFLCVGLLDLMHTLSYKGMPYFITDSSVSKATWFWISARITEALFLMMILKHKNENHYRGLKSLYGISFIYFILISFIIINYNSELPILVIEGQGVTSLKIFLEYLISILHFGAIIMIINYYWREKNISYLTLVNALVFILLGELVFTLYKNVYDIYTFLGHVYKVLGYFYLLKSIYISTVEEPFFRELRANNRLKNKEKEIAAIVESSVDGIVGMSLDGIITSWNLGAVNIYGYLADEVIGKHISILVPKESIYEQEIMQKIKVGEQVNLFETSRQRKDGKLIQVSLTYSPIVDDNDKVIGVSSIARDITERKQMEAKIRLNQQRLEALVKINNMTNATVKEIGDFALEQMLKLTDSEFGYLSFVNKDETQIKMFVFSKSAMLECQITDRPLVYSVLDGGLWAEAIRQRRPIIINDYMANNDGNMGLPNCRVPLIRILNVPIFDRKRIVMQAVVANKSGVYNQSDVKQLSLFTKSMWTLIQRKYAEENLRKSEEKFRNLFQNSMDGIILTKPDGTIIAANPSLCQMLGMSEQEICQIGKSGVVNLFDLKLHKLLTKKQQTGHCKGELNLLHKNGSIVPVEITTSNIYKTSDEEYFTCMIVRDISDRIKIQQEIRRLDKLNLIGQMAAGIGHEVRNPMTTVRGFLQMLIKKPKYDNEKEIFDLMISELDRANEIITKFLSLAKKTSSDLQLHNLNQIIEDLFPLLQADAFNADKNIKIETVSIPDINLNKNEIHQLILNLVRNGLDAMQKGGYVTIETFINRGDVVLAIKDEGSGIDSSLLDKLGTPFLTTKDEGTGLGLATCFSIAKQHNARIDVDTSSKGTTFFIRFKIPG